MERTKFAEAPANPEHNTKGLSGDDQPWFPGGAASENPKPASGGSFGGGGGEGYSPIGSSSSYKPLFHQNSQNPASNGQSNTNTGVLQTKIQVSDLAPPRDSARFNLGTVSSNAIQMTSEHPKQFWPPRQTPGQRQPPRRPPGQQQSQSPPQTLSPPRRTPGQQQSV